MSLFNRAEVVDKNFTSRIKEGKLPDSRTHLSNKNQSISDLDLISIFESQVASRHMDLKARLLKDNGKCYYTIGSSGHEGNAVFGYVFLSLIWHFCIIAICHFSSKVKAGFWYDTFL